MELLQPSWALLPCNSLPLQPATGLYYGTNTQQDVVRSYPTEALAICGSVLESLR